MQVLVGAISMLAMIGSTVAQSGMATSTRYYDDQGSCMCFGADTGMLGGIRTVAISGALYGSGTGACTAACGTCYQITNTGTNPPGMGTAAGAGETMTVIVTNNCPDGGPWCSSGTNSFGYSAHFDIKAQEGELDWNNPIISYERVSCPQAALDAFNAGCGCHGST